MAGKDQRKEELDAMVAGAPPCDLPWPLLEASVSASRIKALAHMLDPSMELDDGAVKVRAHPAHGTHATTRSRGIALTRSPPNSRACVPFPR